MMKITSCLILGSVLTIYTQTFGNNIQIIPEPVKVEGRTGTFILNTSTIIEVKSESKTIPWPIKDFINFFSKVSGISLPAIATNQNLDGISANFISVSIDSQLNIPKKGYIIDINQNNIDISSKDTAGLFYAIQSLKQLLPVQVFAESLQPGIQWSMPCVYILDYPKFSYRGMHLDVSRHFYDIDYIKRYIDYLAMFKLNVFHWHLTDSHGWRLEIKQYPRLTSIGAWRADRTGIPFTIAEATGTDEPRTYGGYYTQDEVKEVIEYARKRYITIIPEIEMPGHCTAALVSYPQFTCLNGKPLSIPCGYPGDLEHNFCVGNDSTFIFIENILSEVINLFPGEFIHIGGDEVRKEPWQQCPRCQKRIKEQGLKNEKQLQAYFTNRIDSFITSRGKRLIGWDEILEAGISPNAAVMSWRGEEGGTEAAQKQHDVVMAPFRNVYFDLYQSDPKLEPSIAYYPVLLPTVYSLNPIPPVLNTEDATHILGGEACLWTENIETKSHLEYMLFPRMLALAEVLWTPTENRDYQKFIEKVEKQFKIFDLSGINYAKSMYNVAIVPEFNPDQRCITINLSNQVNKYQIKYTTNGSIPLSGSVLYNTPLKITESKTIHTGTFLNDSLLGKINTDSFAIHKAIGIFPKIERQFQPEGDVKPVYQKLTDGILGTIEPYDGRWISFNDSVVNITLDLSTTKKIKSIEVRCMEDQVGYIQLPSLINFSVSQDGKKYRQIFSQELTDLPLKKTRNTVTFRKNNIDCKTRFIEITLKNPNLKPGIPGKNLIFLDEIIVN